MSTNEILAKVETAKTLMTMIDELNGELEAIKDEIKNEMTAQGVDEMTVSCFKVRYKTVTSSRFDSASFKETHKELYNQYCKAVTSKRFTIA